MTDVRRGLLAACVLVVLTGPPASAADIFRFYAPPGGAYLNSSFEQESVEDVVISVEHEGVAIPAWFIAVSAGGASVFEPRELSLGADALEYQLYGEHPPSTKILKEPPTLLTADNVITSGDFGSEAASTEVVAFTAYAHIPAGQFVPSGEYTDTVTLSLYTGDFADPGTHVLVDTASLTVTGRMARLLDVYADREPGIRYMDLTTNVSGRLIAAVNERSNSATGYTVSVSSANLAADTGGATSPYFKHASASGTLDYSLTYDGVLVAGWTAGSALLTDSAGTTAPEWLTRELRISYSGTPTLPAGDYEDVLVITISAK